MLVGTRPDDWRRDFAKIVVGDRILVYDFDKYEFFGPYQVTEHRGGKPIEPAAWNRKFPSQARIENLNKTKTIGLQAINDAVGVKRVMRRDGTMPSAYVKGDTANKLAELFEFPPRTASPSPPSKPHPVAPRPLPNDTPRYRTVQGIEVRSKAEREIANQFARWGIECHYEKEIPCRYYCDFYLPKYDVYIEYWGIENNPEYSAKRDIKTRVYTDHKLRLLELVPADEADLESTLRQKLLHFGISPDPTSASIERNWFIRLLRWFGLWSNK